MVLETLARLIGDKEPNPNKFTLAMGELIKKAREEAGLSQAELANLVYRRRATVSDMENGKVEVSAGSLALLAAALNKPITYFFPNWMKREIREENLSSEEKELILNFRDIYVEELQRIAIQQVKALSEFDPVEILLEKVDFAKSEYEVREEVKKVFHKGDQK